MSKWFRLFSLHNDRGAKYVDLFAICYHGRDLYANKFIVDHFRDMTDCFYAESMVTILLANNFNYVLKVARIFWWTRSQKVFDEPVFLPVVSMLLTLPIYHKKKSANGNRSPKYIRYIKYKVYTYSLNFILVTGRRCKICIFTYTDCPHLNKQKKLPQSLQLLPPKLKKNASDTLLRQTTKSTTKTKISLLEVSIVMPCCSWSEFFVIQ